VPRTKLHPDIWVDASTTWASALLWVNIRRLGTLLPGWKSEGRDIGWAESIVLELAVLWIVEQGFCDSEIRIHGDNTGAIDALLRGRSRNAARNDTIIRLSASLITSSLTILPVYVTSALNRADPISRGILGPSHLRLSGAFSLPEELSPLLIYA